MSLEGMDVDQMQGLARQIDSDAQALYNLVTGLSAVVGGLSLFWHGPMVTTFEQDWQSRNRPALLAAYDTLTNLHTHLVNNINQQVSASGADSGWTVTGVLEDGITAIGAVGIPIGLISEIGKGADDLTGASLLKQGWSYATGDHLFRLAPEDVKWARETADVVEGSHLDMALKVVGLAGSAVSLYDAGGAVLKASDDMNDGNYAGAANEFVQGVADGLQAYPSPVTYLAGVDLKLLDQVANLDWKDTPNPFSGSNFEQDYAPVLKSMFTSGSFWEQAGKTLWGDM